MAQLHPLRLVRALRQMRPLREPFQPLHMLVQGQQRRLRLGIGGTVRLDATMAAIDGRGLKGASKTFWMRTPTHQWLVHLRESCRRLHLSERLQDLEDGRKRPACEEMSKKTRPLEAPQEEMRVVHGIIIRVVLSPPAAAESQERVSPFTRFLHRKEYANDYAAIITFFSRACSLQ